MKKRKLQSFGRVTRAQNLRTHILEGRLGGKRTRGQRRRWIDDIKDLTGEIGRGKYGHSRSRWESWCTCPRPPTLSIEEGTRLVMLSSLFVL